MNTEELNAPQMGSVPECAFEAHPHNEIREEEIEKNPLDVIRDNISDAVAEPKPIEHSVLETRRWFFEALKEDPNAPEPKLVYENSFTNDVPDLSEAHRKALDIQFEDLDIDSEMVYLATSKKIHKTHTPEELEEIDNYCLSQCDRKALSWAYSDTDLLKLSGIDIPCDEEIEEDFRQALLVYVAKNGLPANIDLSLAKRTLTINEVPTKISSKSVEMAFLGLAELVSKDEALTLVGGIIGEKLKQVF